MANIVCTKQVPISDALLEKITDYIKSENPVNIYFDHNDEINIEQIKEAFESKEGNCKLAILEDAIAEQNDYWHNAQFDQLKQALNEFKKEIATDLNITIQELLIGETASLLINDFLDIIEVSVNLKPLMPVLNITVQLNSNYDCINSHWYENQNGYYYENTYFGHVVDLLQFNPKVLATKMKAKGFNVQDKWPNFPKRKPLVDMDAFLVERENASCGASVLMFLGRMDSYDILDNSKGTVTIPKGNKCGFYSYSQGGGSPFDLELLEDFVMPLNKPLITEYDNLSLNVDAFEQYTISDCYGVYDRFFGNTITIKPFEDENVQSTS